jgi:hypothetical protein
MASLLGGAEGGREGRMVKEAQWAGLWVPNITLAKTGQLKILNFKSFYRAKVAKTAWCLYKTDM